MLAILDKAKNAVRRKDQSEADLNEMLKRFMLKKGCSQHEAEFMIKNGCVVRRWRVSQYSVYLAAPERSCLCGRAYPPLAPLLATWGRRARRR